MINDLTREYRCAFVRGRERVREREYMCLFEIGRAENYLRGSMADLLFILFGFSCFAYDELKQFYLFGQIQTMYVLEPNLQN